MHDRHSNLIDGNHDFSSIAFQIIASSPPPLSNQSRFAATSSQSASRLRKQKAPRATSVVPGMEETGGKFNSTEYDDVVGVVVSEIVWG